METLRQPARQRAQEGGLLLGLHALGGDAQVQPAGHRDDGGDDGRIVGIMAQVLDERAVDLQRVDGEALQVRQARVAGAEVVDGQAHAHLVQLLERLHGLVGVVHQHALGQLELEQRRREAAVAQRLLDHHDQLLLAELPRR